MNNPIDPQIIASLLELASRRLIVRVLIDPSSKKMTASLLTALQKEDVFHVVFVNYFFIEKQRGNTEEKCIICRTFGEMPGDENINLVIATNLRTWEKVSPTWCSGNERVIENLISDSIIRFRRKNLNGHVQEFLSRIHVQVVHEGFSVLTTETAELLNALDLRLGALLAENRPW